MARRFQLEQLCERPRTQRPSAFASREPSRTALIHWAFGSWGRPGEEMRVEIGAPPSGQDLEKVAYILRSDDFNERLRRLEKHVSDGAVCVPINTFAPLPYLVTGKIAIVIREQDSEYQASYFDANIHTAGDTEQEAFDNAKSMIVTLYEKLSSLSHQKLGLVPAKQLAVLRDVMVRIP